MTADVDIIIGERDKVLQLPLEAVNMKETVKVKAHINEQMANKIKDQKVDVVMTRLPDKKFSGKVTGISPMRSGFSTREVTITMDGSPPELQVGANPSANITASSGEKIQNVEARIDSEREYFVKVVKDEAKGEDEKSEVTGIKRFLPWKKSSNKEPEIQDEERIIKVGDRTSSSIEILGGLNEGDKIRIVPIGGGEPNKKGNGK